MSGLDASLGEFRGNPTDFPDRPADQCRVLRRVIFADGRAFARGRMVALKPFGIGYRIRTLHDIVMPIGGVEMMISPVFLVRGTIKWKRQFLRGLKKMMKGLGRAAGLIGVMPKPYRNIVGS